MLLFIVTHSYPIIHCCTIIIITCHVISPQLTVQCHTQKKAAPCVVSRGSAVADQNNFYCTSAASTPVYRYQLGEDQWNVLPSCRYMNSGLVVIDGVLTAVGGWDGSHCTKKLFTLQQSQWVEEYPPMNTAHSCPAVVSTSNGRHVNILVIGGDGDGASTIATVELYNTGSGTWSQITSLPQPFACISATICGNQLHVIGGDGDGYSCSLQALLPSDQPISSRSITFAQSITHSSTWTPLPRLPMRCSTAATLCGQLVIIGGLLDTSPLNLSPVNSIHQLVDGEWVNIGSMSGKKWLCLVASPSPDTMVVVGGFDAKGYRFDSVEVCVAE